MGNTAKGCGGTSTAPSVRWPPSSRRFGRGSTAWTALILSLLICTSGYRCHTRPVRAARHHQVFCPSGMIATTLAELNFDGSQPLAEVVLLRNGHITSAGDSSSTAFEPSSCWRPNRSASWTRTARYLALPRSLRALPAGLRSGTRLIGAVKRAERWARNPAALLLSVG